MYSKTSRRLFPEMPNHRLNTVCENLNITLNNHHDALEDSRALCRNLTLPRKTLWNRPIEEIGYFEIRL